MHCLLLKLHLRRRRAIAIVLGMKGIPPRKRHSEFYFRAFENLEVKRSLLCTRGFCTRLINGLRAPR